MADASIYNALARPPKSAMEYAGEYNALAAQREQMANARDTRAKNALLMRQAQQEFDDDQAYRRTLSGLPTTATAEEKIATLRNSANPLAIKQADAMAAAQFKAQKDQADLAKTQAEADKIKAEQAIKTHSAVKSGLGFVLSNPTSEAAESVFVQLEKALGVSMDAYRQQIAGFQNPDQFKLWAAGHSLEADKQLATFTTRNTGGSTDTLAQNPVLGTATVVNTVKNTQSPESVASIAEQRRANDMQDRRSREANEQQRQANRTQIIETADGVMLVDKGTGQARPAVASGGQPLPGKVPDSVKKDLVSINQQRSLIDGALREVDKAPQAFSFTRGAVGGLNESIAGRMFDNDQEAQVRSYVYNNVSRVINERAGAAQSAQELQRLKSFLPADTDTADQIKSKLKGFRTYLDDYEKGTTAGQRKPAQQSVVKVYNPQTGRIE